MGSAFHQLCPRYSGTLTPTAPTANRLWETFTFTLFHVLSMNAEVQPNLSYGVNQGKDRKWLLKTGDPLIQVHLQCILGHRI